MNANLWKRPLRMQNPFSKVEIVAFDSAEVLLYTTERELYEKFRRAYPLSTDLDEHLREPDENA